MSYLLNDPTDFADESIDGFVAANRGFVRRVSGGVARATRIPPDRVAVVIGGGSGHYPAFAGLVGDGLADAAAMGNVFASPSAQQVYSVAKAVAGNAGVLLSYGNYAGDVLNFDQAQQRLIEDGIPCRTVVVTDDISSASARERHRRRGVAGDLAVFRVAAWAAAQGWSLDEVHAMTTRANNMTRTLGVAFSGTTLPGAEAPLFTVPKGRMAVGMGIHGEPGIDEKAMPTARELAHLLVEELLTNRPQAVPATRGARVAVILNGLGSVKSEELFVVYATVAPLLEQAGVTVIDPEVGEFATSFEMAGVSLTLMWLDEDLEAAWRSPASTPAYHKGSVPTSFLPLVEDALEESVEHTPRGSSESIAVAPLMVEAIASIRRVVDEHVEELGRLDAVAGDGDHGIGMQRGAAAAAAAAELAAAEGAGGGTVVALAGDAWANRAGGTSGALWGSALRAVGTRIGDAKAPTARDVVEAVEAGRETIQRSGKAQIGDKTMVDALVPFTETLRAEIESGHTLTDAWIGAARAATAAAAVTADLLPRLGRARPHLEKSLGTPDPGAVSFALAMTAIAAVLKTNIEGAHA